MRAAVCRAYGPPGVVSVEELPAPAVGPSEVLVDVQAASINFPDVLIVADAYQVHVPTPFVPGSEFAGQVLELGPGVSGFVPGDRVFGTALIGAFAEEVVVPALSLTSIPAGVGVRQAAAFGVAYRTAYHVLRSVAQLTPGRELLVLGAGSGVGLAAVQLGSVMGATVTAVASSADKLSAARTGGAARLINYRDGELRAALKEEVPGGFDVVVDPVGGELAEPALRSLRWGGRFVTVGYASGSIPRIPLNLVLLKGIEVLGFEFLGFATHTPDELDRNEAELMDLLAQGTVVPHVGAEFDLDDVVSALTEVSEGRVTGKVVLRMGK